jgi:hypothetical protein
VFFQLFSSSLFIYLFIYSFIHLFILPSAVKLEIELFIYFSFSSKAGIELIRIPKEVQNDKIENVAGSLWFSLFMDDTGKRKLSSMPNSTGLCSIQHEMEVTI